MGEGKGEGGALVFSGEHRAAVIREGEGGEGGGIGVGWLLEGGEEGLLRQGWWGRDLGGYAVGGTEKGGFGSGEGWESGRRGGG